MFNRKKEFPFAKEVGTSHSISGEKFNGEASVKSPYSVGGKAMIGSTVVIEGQITSGEDLVVEGNVFGTITAKEHEVTIGKSGQLKADIVAKVVRVEGNVQGDISGGEKVIIANTGNVLGNIDAPRVTLEDGAKFKGSIEMDPDEPATAESPVKAVVNGKADLFPVGADSETSKAS